ncbi:hypothetical protein [Gordonia polyisoprenivorans]|uniref:hypothetical protein n=1 Tax=Gordonia polyisoprenivorans TaxID=84595 RepID=UPI0002EAA95D|nr:hypothetical protein [Gordonia polyisoprenivorans]
MSAPTADYDALGRETAQAFMSGQLTTEGLAEVCRAVLDLDPARARSLVRSIPVRKAHP